MSHGDGVMVIGLDGHAEAYTAEAKQVESECSSPHTGTLHTLRAGREIGEPV